MLRIRHNFGEEQTGGCTITNRGILACSPGSSLTVKPYLHTINNQGKIEVYINGSVTFTDILINEPNAVIKLLGGTLAAKTIIQKPGAILEGFGGVTGNLVIDPNAIIKITGSTNMVGDVTIAKGATLEIRDGVTLITGQTTCNGTIHLKGGYLIPQGGLSGNCNVLWESGLYVNVSAFNLDGKVNLKDFALFADTWLWQATK